MWLAQQTRNQKFTLPDAVKKQVTEWQSRQQNAMYSIVYRDCIVVKFHQNGSVINKAAYSGEDERVIP